MRFFRFVAEDVREHHGPARLPHVRRHGRPRRAARAAAARSTTGRPRGSTSPPSFAAPDRPTARRAAACARRSTTLDDHLDQELIRAGAARASRRGEPVQLDAADPQRPPHGRHDPQPRDRRAHGAAGPARRHDRAHVHRLGRPELRRVPRPGRHAAADRRRERLPGQGALRRPDHRRARRRARPSSRRRTSSSATSCSTAPPAARSSSTAWPASGSPSATAAPMAVVEGVGDHGCEYMTGGMVVVLGPHRRQLRRRHERRHRLRARRAPAVRHALQPGHGRPRDRLARRRTRRSCAHLIERHLQLDRQRAGRADPRQLARRVCRKFVKVMPIDYRKALERMRREERAATTRDRLAPTEEVLPMGKPTGFLEYAREDAAEPPGRRAASATGTRSTCRCPRTSSQRRPRAAWTAAFPSATRPAAR